MFPDFGRSLGIVFETPSFDSALLMGLYWIGGMIFLGLTAALLALAAIERK
jgi:hypothetical protein